MSGWGKKPGRGYFHFWKPGSPKSVCALEYHMGAVKEWHKDPPKGVKICKKCTERMEGNG